MRRRRRQAGRGCRSAHVPGQGHHRRSELRAQWPHRTGADGGAATAIAIDYRGGCFDRWFYARVPGKLVGGLRWLCLDANGPAWPEKPVIRLQPSREVRGVVHVPEGMSARIVSVRMLSLSVLDDTSPSGSPFPRQREFRGLRDTLPALFDAEVGDDGTFALRDLPQRALLYLAAEGEGLGQAQWFNATLPERRIPELVPFTMVREAVVAGTVIDPAGKPLADADVSLRIDRTNQTTGQMCSFEARSDAGGRFRIAGLPAGEFAVTLAHPDLVMRPQPLTLGVGETRKDLAFTLEPAIEVRGLVRSSATRAGVERVGISAITDDDRHWRLGHAMTDPQGRFVLRLPKGATSLYVAGVPAGHQQPSTRYQDLLRVDVQPGDKTLTELVFELDPAK